MWGLVWIALDVLPPHLHGVSVWTGLSWGTEEQGRGQSMHPSAQLSFTLPLQSLWLWFAFPAPWGGQAKVADCVEWSPCRHGRRFSLKAGSSWGTVAAWLTLYGLSLSTQQCSEPLIIMWCFSWGEISVSWNHISAFHTPHSSTHLYLLNKVNGLFSRFLQPLSESTLCLCGWPLLFCQCHKLLN